MKIFDILEILFIIFLALKVTNLITWSWWIIFLPLFLRIGISALAFLILYVIIGIAADTEKEDGE